MDACGNNCAVVPWARFFKKSCMRQRMLWACRPPDFPILRPAYSRGGACVCCVSSKLPRPGRRKNLTAHDLVRTFRFSSGNWWRQKHMSWIFANSLQIVLSVWTMDDKAPNLRYFDVVILRNFDNFLLSQSVAERRKATKFPIFFSAALQLLCTWLVPSPV